MMWHFSCYPLLEFLKYKLKDSTCSTHSNSVSGHYYFHIYGLLTMLYLMVEAKRSTVPLSNFISFRFLNKIVRFRIRVQTMFILFFYLLAVVSSFWTMFRTIRYGYHSLRQSIYGVLFALFWHYFLVDRLDKVNLVHIYPNLLPTEEDVYFGNKVEDLERNGLIIVLSCLLIASWSITIIFGDELAYSTYELVGIGCTYVGTMFVKRFVEMRHRQVPNNLSQSDYENKKANQLHKNISLQNYLQHFFHFGSSPRRTKIMDINIYYPGMS